MPHAKPGAPLPVLLLSQYPSRQRIADRESNAYRQGKVGRHGEVKGHGRTNPGQPGHDRHEELSIVIIVQIAAGKVGVIGRKIRAAQAGIEVGNVHQLFAALPRLPQVGVEDANADKGKECQPKHSFPDQQYPPPLPHKVAQLAPVACDQQRRNESHHHDCCTRQRQAVLQPVQAGGQPDQIADHDQADGTREQVAPVAQPTKEDKGDRPGQPTQDADDQPPQ